MDLDCNGVVDAARGHFNPMVAVEKFPDDGLNAKVQAADTCLEDLQTALRRLTLDKTTHVPVRLQKFCNQVEAEPFDIFASDSLNQMLNFLDGLPVALLSNCHFHGNAVDSSEHIFSIGIADNSAGCLVEQRTTSYFLEFLARISFSRPASILELLNAASRRKFLPGVLIRSSADPGLFSVVQSKPVRSSSDAKLPTENSTASMASKNGSKKTPEPHKFLVTPLREKLESRGTTATEASAGNAASSNGLGDSMKRSLAQRLMSPLKIEIPPPSLHTHGSAGSSKDDFSLGALIKKSPIGKKLSLNDPRLFQKISAGEVSDNELTIVSPIIKEFPPDVRSVFQVPTQDIGVNISVRVSVDLTDDDASASSSTRNSSDDKENDPEVEGLLLSSEADQQNIFSMSPPNPAPIHRHSSPPSTSANGAAAYIPHIDFKALHEHYENTEPVRWNFSSSDARSQRLSSDDCDENDAENKGDDEWMAFSSERAFSHVIPSSKRKFISIETPPGSANTLLQSQLPVISQTRFENPSDAKLRKLEKRIKSARRKLDFLEDEFLRANGRKPSQFDRLQCDQMKKYVQDIALLKREIKAVKMAEANAKCLLRSPESPSFSALKECKSVLPLDEMVAIAWKVVNEQREQTERPMSLEEMSVPQLRQEKLTVQKVLLHLESAHGRPVAPEDREQVRSLYDWYRAVKRTIARYVSPRGSLCELKTIPEGQDIYFHMLPEIEEEREKRRLTNEMLLTSPVRSFLTKARTLKSVLKLDTVDGFAPDNDEAGFAAVASTPSDEAEFATDNNCDESGSQTAREAGSFDDDSDSTNQFYANIHRMPPDQLYKVHRSLMDRRRALRKVVSEVDSMPGTAAAQSFCDSWRKGATDKSPAQLEYKKIKAKLKLVEALLSKHRASC